MLREAVRVGLVLNPSGFALQSALTLPHSQNRKIPLAAHFDSKSPGPSTKADELSPITAGLLALHELTEILKSQEDDPKKGIDGWVVCRPLIAQLPQDVLAEMVEMAALLDSYPDEADRGDTGHGLVLRLEAAGGTRTPLSRDAKLRYSESLTAVWRPLEGMLLATRVWMPDGRQKKNVKR